VSDEAGRWVRIAAFLVAGALGAWTAGACHRARRRGAHGSDAAIWAALAVVYLAMAQLKSARMLGWLIGLGIWLRAIARQLGYYQDRRLFQIAATLAVLAVAAILMAIGIATYWDAIRRYRLAIGFTGIAVGFAAIRFISLHEVDAWNRDMPWIGALAELTAAAGASAIALLRLRQVRTSTSTG
jgi:hypothetical protein